MAEVSIIVPVYNGEKYIEKCLTSLLQQSFRDLEVILVSDGSTDSTLSICRTIAEKDPRLKVFQKKNGGVSSARNVGLSHASGKWIMFSDADDSMDRETVEKALALAEHEQVHLVLWNATEDRERGSVVRHFSQKKLVAKTQEELESIRYRLFSEYSPDGKKEPGVHTVYCRLIAREIIYDHHLRFIERLKYHEDAMFMLEVYENADSFVMVDEPWYHRLMHEGSAISKYDPHRVEMTAWIAEAMNAYFDKYNKPAEYREFFKSSLSYMLMQCILRCCIHRDNPAGRIEKYRSVKKLLASEPYVSTFRELPKADHIILSKKIFMLLAKYRLAGLLILYTECFEWARQFRK